jgi:nucleoside-diphosphate-sugar epimerase
LENGMSDQHLVVGAGPVGSATAIKLADQGQHVTIVSRSGRGPNRAGVTRVSADASDTARLVTLAEGASAIYNCLNPAYHRWPQDWPPMAGSLLAAAESTGALLVTAANLYPYGPTDGPMVEGDPDAATGTKARVRAQMTSDAFAAHNAGRIRAVEVRASDYVGAGVQSHLSRLVPRIVTGKSVQVVGSADQPHTWTYVPDMASLMVSLVDRDDAWGRVWHTPSQPPRSQREAVTDLCAAAGVAPVKVATLPAPVLSLAGLFSPTTRELKETLYQFEKPFVMDSTAAQQRFGLAPTGWETICAEMIAAARV